MELSEPIKQYSIIDMETVSYEGGILEIGAIKINEQLEVVEELEVRTNVEWPLVHVSGKIPSERPLGKYSEKEAILILKNFIAKSIVIGFNLPFEERILAKFNYAINKKFDLMAYMRKKYKLIKYNLGACAELMGVKEIDKHTALGDCQTIYDILKKEMGVIRSVLS